MINNYLDWAKRQRKYCVKCAVRYHRVCRERESAWAQGFYRGLSVAYDYSGQNLKRLQKDIEAFNNDNDGATLSSIHEQAFKKLWS